jgi:hypothetical protein
MTHPRHFFVGGPMLSAPLVPLALDRSGPNHLYGQTCAARRVGGPAPEVVRGEQSLITVAH